MNARDSDDRQGDKENSVEQWMRVNRLSLNALEGMLWREFVNQ